MPTSSLIYDLSKQFPNGFMVSISSFKSLSIQHDVQLANYGPIMVPVKQTMKPGVYFWAVHPVQHTGKLRSVKLGSVNKI